MRRLIFIFIFCFLLKDTFAQYLLKQNIYYDDLNYYNPSVSFSDTSRVYYATFYTKYKILNSSIYSEKPYDFYTSFQGLTQGGFGHFITGFSYDGYSFFDRYSLFGGYGYKWNFNEHYLGIGARCLFQFDVVNWNKLSVSHYVGQKMFVLPDIDIGLNYQWKGLNLGLSVKNVLAIGERVDKTILLQNRRTLFTNISYDFRLSNVKIAPFMLFSYDSELSLDIGVFIELFKYAKVSYILRAKELRHIFLLGGELPCGLCLDAAFDFSGLIRDKNIDIRLGYRF